MANSERRLRLLSLLAARGPDLQIKGLCEVCAEVTGMSGAGIMLLSRDLPQGSVGTTNEVSALIEELQYTLHEGPSFDAYHEDRSVLEPDLAQGRAPRWLAFRGPALEAGAQAVFAFPLRVGEVRLGSLNLYCDRPRPLTEEQHADALVLADMAAQTVLLLQAHAPPDRLAAQLAQGGEFLFVAHQAAGMVAAQLDVSITEALIRLRAYAFGADRPLSEVATDVVARNLRIGDRNGDEDPRP